MVLLVVNQYKRKNIYTHDSVGNAIEMSFYRWYSSTNEWKHNKTTQYEYTYLSETDKVVPNFVKDGDYEYKGVVSEVKTKEGTTTYYWSTREIEEKGNGDDDVNISEITSGNSSLRIYPNPTSIGELRIENGGKRINNVEVYDAMGKLLQSVIGNRQSEIVLDISHLAVGIYFVKVDGKMFKMVKE